VTLAGLKDILNFDIPILKWMWKIYLGKSKKNAEKLYNICNTTFQKMRIYIAKVAAYYS
jgi:hypothetical protein